MGVQKTESLWQIFSSLQPQKCAMFSLHPIKHILLKRKIPRSLNLVGQFCFYGNFLKHSRFQSLFSLCELIVIHYVFVLFTWIRGINGLPHNNLWMATKDRFFYSLLLKMKWKLKMPTDVSRNGHRIQTIPNQIQWSWYDSFLKIMFYLMK